MLKSVELLPLALARKLFVGCCKLCLPSVRYTLAIVGVGNPLATVLAFRLPAPGDTGFHEATGGLSPPTISRVQSTVSTSCFPCARRCELGWADRWPPVRQLCGAGPQQLPSPSNSAGRHNLRLPILAAPHVCRCADAHSDAGTAALIESKLTELVTQLMLRGPVTLIQHHATTNLIKVWEHAAL